VEGVKNLIGPVIRLRRLSDDELLALIGRVTRLYAQQYDSAPNVSDEQMAYFLGVCLERAGADSMITPREMLRDYMTVLNILMQNPDVTFEELVGRAVTLKTETPSEENGAQAPQEKRAAYTLEEIDF
jgi:hypothetical protein